MWRYRRSKNNAAFMLLEVILSVLIVTVGIVFVIGSFITSIKTFKISKTYLDALYLMEEKMWEYEAFGQIEEGADSGTFESRKGAEWEVEAEKMQDLPLNETNIEVSVKEGERSRKYRVAAYFFNKE